MNAPENPPAFPRDERYLGHNGMTLRDWFAGQALVGFINQAPAQAVEDICSGVRAGRPLAYGAYALADAMLIARGESQSTSGVGQ